MLCPSRPDMTVLLYLTQVRLVNFYSLLDGRADKHGQQWRSKTNRNTSINSDRKWKNIYESGSILLVRQILLLAALQPGIFV